MKLLKRFVGIVVAALFGFITLLSIYQFFTTGQWQWLPVTLFSLGFTVVGLALALASITFKEFVESIMELFRSFTS